MTKFLRCARRVSNYGCRGASAGRTRSRTRRGNMPRGGSKPGERRGGRKKGSLSEATIERALKAERELVNANETGKSSPRNISKISRSLRTNVSFHGRWVRGRDRPSSEMNQRVGATANGEQNETRLAVVGDKLLRLPLRPALLDQ